MSNARHRDIVSFSLCSVSAMARKMIDFSKLNSEELKDFRDKYDAYIFDMDGCLIKFDVNPMEGVNDALNEISKHGKSIHLVTDNCTVTLKDFAARINKMFPTIKKENIMTSGHLVIRYLKEINFNKKIYVIGTDTGIIRELKDYGYQVVCDEGKTPKVSIADLKKMKFEKEIGAVVVAFDFYFNYLKMFKAVNYLADPEVLLIQTNILTTAVIGPICPLTGSTIPCVLTSSERDEPIATGKGGDYCSQYLKSLGYPVERVLFVGDGLQSDIQAGNKSGIDTMLTLSGSTTLKDLEIAKNESNELFIPTYYTKSVADLIKAFKTG